MMRQLSIHPVYAARWLAPRLNRGRHMHMAACLEGRRHCAHVLLTVWPSSCRAAARRGGARTCALWWSTCASASTCSTSTAGTVGNGAARRRGGGAARNAAHVVASACAWWPDAGGPCAAGRRTLLPRTLPPSAAPPGLSAYWSGVSPNAPAVAKYQPHLYFPKPTPGLSEIEPRWGVGGALKLRSALGALHAGHSSCRALPPSRAAPRLVCRAPC